MDEHIAKAKIEFQRSQLFAKSAETTGLPVEAVAVLCMVAIRHAVESVYFCNRTNPPKREVIYEHFYEQHVLHGGFPRGIEKKIAELQGMAAGDIPCASDGGLKVAKEILKELHRTIKAWLKEAEKKEG